MPFDRLFALLRDAGFAAWVKTLESRRPDWLVRHGDYPRWAEALSQLPEIENLHAEFDQPAITLNGNCEDKPALLKAFKGLMPWRKGPYRIAGMLVDSEWRSDYKWQRVLPHLSSLKNRRVLDIGCGNGYHCWRMLNESPKLVIGIEPSVLFNLQFRAINHYLRRPDIHLLPVGIDDLPPEMNWFDQVFSMGVFYHRRSPVDHLMQLKNLLAPGGQLCLETLVIDAGAGNLLLPPGRYARMNNVWFIPSADELAGWLARCGFESIKIVDISVTTTEEQRSTEWMQFESLAECLDPKNPTLTVEGLPAPKRAVLIATRPA